MAFFPGYSKRQSITNRDSLEKMLPLQKRVITVVCVERREEEEEEGGGCYVHDVAAVTWS